MAFYECARCGEAKHDESFEIHGQPGNRAMEKGVCDDCVKDVLDEYVREHK